jgi:hypothetical protein
LLGAVLLLGCSEKPSVKESAIQAESSRGRIVRIVFDLPGDDIGGQESRTLLEEIKTAILSRKAGSITSSGFGMGNMEIVVAYERDESIEEMRRIIARIYPRGRFRIEQRAR